MTAVVRRPGERQGVLVLTGTGIGALGALSAAALEAHIPSGPAECWRHRDRRGLYGHIAAHELLPGTIDGRVLGCKAQVSETREGK